MGALIGLDYGTATIVAVRIPGQLPAPDQAWAEPAVSIRSSPSDLVHTAGGVDWHLATPAEAQEGGKNRLRGLKRVLATPPGSPEAETYLRSQELPVSCEADGGLSVEGRSLPALAAIAWRNFPRRLFDRNEIEMIGLAFPGYVGEDRLATIVQMFQAVSDWPIVICSEVEAVAAAYSYAGLIGPNRRVAFVNMGAGQAWAALVYFGPPGSYEVLTEQGDPWLGGDDCDQLLAGLLRKHLTEGNGNGVIPPEVEKRIGQRLLAEAEVAKREMGKPGNVEVLLPYLLLGKDGRPQHFRFSLSTAEAEAEVADLVGRLQALGRSALESCGLQHYDVEHLVLLGGEAQLRPFAAALSDPVPGGGVFGRPPYRVDPGKVSTSFGAALIAGRSVGRAGVPTRLSQACGDGLVAVLRETTTDLWPSAVQLLSAHPELHDWPPALQARLVKATALVSLEEALQTLRNQGESGLDQVIERDDWRRSPWSFTGTTGATD